jgi:hypothetical protein
MAATIAACEVAGGAGVAIQEVAAPSGLTVTPRAADQLAVSWSADLAAVQYRVYQAAGGGALALAATVTGGPPSTSYIADSLAAGVQYCFAVQSGYTDGSTSDVGAPVCGPVATGGGGASGLVRISVPLFGPNTSSVFPSRFLATSGALGVSVQLPPLPIGATITELDARVRDNTSGPTTVVLALAEQADGSFVEPQLPPTGPSSGAGTFQTLTLGGLARRVQPLHDYYAGVFVNTGTPGTAECRVTAIDVTYQPAAQ